MALSAVSPWLWWRPLLLIMIGGGGVTLSVLWCFGIGLSGQLPVPALSQLDQTCHPPFRRSCPLLSPAQLPAAECELSGCRASLSSTSMYVLIIATFSSEGRLHRHLFSAVPNHRSFLVVPDSLMDEEEHGSSFPATASGERVCAAVVC